MNYILTTYKSKPAIFCKETKCFVLFGSKKDLVNRLKQLNKN